MGISRIIGKVFGYAGRKMTSAGARFEARASKFTASAVKEPEVLKGPTLSEIISKQPKALPAPTQQQLAAERPLLNTAKLTGYGSEQLNMTQVITKDGTHIRYYRKPGDDRVVFETATKGALRTERFNGENGNFIYLKSIGDQKYLVQKQGDLTFINRRSMAYDRGMNQQIGTDMVLDNKYGANLKLEKQYGTNGYRKNSGNIYFKDGAQNKSFEFAENGCVQVKGGYKDAIEYFGYFSNKNSRELGLQISQYGEIEYKPNVIDNLLSSFKA